MKRTRRVKRKPHGTLRKSRRYRRGGYVEPKTFLTSSHAFGVSHGGRKRKRSSRRKRGGYTQKSPMFYAIRSSPH